MDRPCLSKWILLLGLFGVLWHGQLEAAASEEYTPLFVQITDAMLAVEKGDQVAAKEQVIALQEAFLKVEHHDSEAGKIVQSKLAIKGEVTKEALVAISTALMAFDEEQHPVDIAEEKAALLSKLAAPYQVFQSALESQDREQIRVAFQQLNTIWTRNEGIVRKFPAYYGQIETALSFLRSSIETEPVDVVAIQSQFETVQTAVQDFVDEKEPAQSIATDLTLDDGIALLKDALSAFQAGRTKQAQGLMKEFITIWPSIEGDISTRNNALYNRVENQSPLILVKGGEPRYQEQLQRLIEELSALDTTASYHFVDVALVLLREGIEALLIILALVSGLRSSTVKRGLGNIYGGAGLGLLASVGVALVLHRLFPAVTAASHREVLEGIVGLFAVFMLFIVGMWLHSKASVRQWNQFMEEQLQQVLTKKSYRSLTFLAFLAVFREGAETILFYTGMLPRTAPSQFVLGIGVAVVALFMVAFVLTRASDKMAPHRLFFYLTWLIYGLAFKMLGVSISALQLTAVLPRHLVSGVPTIQMIGLYPTIETLVPQLIFIGLILFVTFKKRDSYEV